MLKQFLDWLRKPILQGVRGETLGPRETIIPPRGGSGTVGKKYRSFCNFVCCMPANLSVADLKSDWKAVLHKKMEFADDDATFFTTEEHWGIDCGGVARIKIHQPRWAHNKWNDVWDLFLTPYVARNVAAELVAIADSVDRQQAQFENNKGEKNVGI